MAGGIYSPLNNLQYRDLSKLSNFSFFNDPDFKLREGHRFWSVHLQKYETFGIFFITDQCVSFWEKQTNAFHSENQNL